MATELPKTTSQVHIRYGDNEYSFTVQPGWSGGVTIMQERYGPTRVRLEGVHPSLINGGGMRRLVIAVDGVTRLEGHFELDEATVGLDVADVVLVASFNEEPRIYAPKEYP